MDDKLADNSSSLMGISATVQETWLSEPSNGLRDRQRAGVVDHDHGAGLAEHVRSRGTRREDLFDDVIVLVIVGDQRRSLMTFTIVNG